MESFLNPIAEELNELAKDVPGLIIPSSKTPGTLREEVLNLTIDQPKGGKLFQSTGVSSFVYNRLRLFERVYVPASSYFLPPDGSFKRCRPFQGT